LPDDNDMTTAFEMAIEYASGMITLYAVLKPPSRSAELDDYCKGLLFGQNGFLLIMRLANFLRDFDKDASYWFYPSAPEKGHRSKGPSMPKIKGNKWSIFSSMANEAVSRVTGLKARPGDEL
jgi:hypothetical protein